MTKPKSATMSHAQQKYAMERIDGKLKKLTTELRDKLSIVFTISDFQKMLKGGTLPLKKGLDPTEEIHQGTSLRTLFDLPFSC